jgi:hypothetical protein
MEEADLHGDVVGEREAQGMLWSLCREEADGVVDVDGRQAESLRWSSGRGPVLLLLNGGGKVPLTGGALMEEARPKHEEEGEGMPSLYSFFFKNYYFFLSFFLMLLASAYAPLEREKESSLSFLVEILFLGKCVVSADP